MAILTLNYFHYRILREYLISRFSCSASKWDQKIEGTYILCYNYIYLKSVHIALILEINLLYVKRKVILKSLVLGKSAWETGLYYAVGFENRWYPGLVLDIKSKGSARMKFLEPVGKRLKWPTKYDIVDVDIKAIICEIEVTPNATGRLWTVQNVDRIDEKFINGSY